MKKEEIIALIREPDTVWKARMLLALAYYASGDDPAVAWAALGLEATK